MTVLWRERAQAERRPAPWTIGRMARGLVTAVGALVMLSALALTVGFFIFVARLERAEIVPPRHAEGVVALTGGADRITDAIALLADGHADRLLISGVNPNTSRQEIGRLAPNARPFLSCCIELGYEAENTIGNARETSRWVRANDIHSLIVVTSNYHMPRALAEIGHAVPGVDLLAYPVVTERAKAGRWLEDSQRLRLVLAEYLKYVAVLARLHLTPDAGPPDAGSAAEG